MSINIFVFRADFDRPKLRPARFLGLIFACFPIYFIKWYFVIFQDCILILDSPLSSYYERYDRSFRHFRRFRRFRSFRKRARRNGGGGGDVNVLVQLTRLVAMLRISTNLELRYGKELQGKGGD